MKKLFKKFLKFFFLENLLLTYLHQRTLKLANGIIHAGPFKGMNYIDQAFASNVCSKLVGTYEKEIQHIIIDLLNVQFDALLDIGALKDITLLDSRNLENVKK